MKFTKLQIRCFPPELTTQTYQDTIIEANPSTKMGAVTTQIQVTTLGDNRSTKMTTVTTPNSEIPMTNHYSTLKIKKKIKKGI